VVGLYSAGFSASGSSDRPNLIASVARRSSLIAFERQFCVAAGGRFVAVGGVAGNLAGKLTTFEGEAPKRVTIQVWDSLEKIKAWRDSKEFAEIRKVGEKYATFSHGFAVEGVPQ
jgi:heme-degrading monooxygenase HmoA